MYRFHIEDPVRFEKSIRVTIEHGHANKLSNDYSSTAYWYQLEPPSAPAAVAAGRTAAPATLARARSLGRIRCGGEHRRALSPVLQ